MNADKIGTGDKNVFNILVTKHKKYFFAALAISPFIAFMPVMPIVYMRTVFGPVINSDSFSYLMWLFILLLFVLVINGILDWVRDRIIVAGTISFLSKLEDKIYKIILEKKNNPWQESQVFTTHLRAMKNILKSPLIGAMYDAPFSLLLLIAIFLIHPLMGMFSLMGVFMAFSIGLLIERRVAPDATEAMKTYGESRAYLTSYFQNPYSATSMGNLPHLFKKWNDKQSRFLLNQGKASSVQSFGSSISQNVMMIQGSMMLGLGTFLTLIGALPPNAAGNLIIAKFIGALAIRPTMMIVMSWAQVVNFKNSIIEIKKMLGEQEEEIKNIKLPPPKGFLRATNVSLSDGNSKNPKKILSDVNFALEPGNILVVLGESGAGKTTLAKLIMGIEAPTAGEIRLDGVSIHKWPKNDLAPYVGYLPQGIEIFGGTIAENICRFRDPSNKDLLASCERVGLNEDIKNFSDGLNHQIDADSLTVSNGFKQKIGIARAIYHNPRYIVLDEPTSKLDADSEDKILTLIENLKKENTTIIVITHNAKIIKKADFLLIIKNGRQKIFNTKMNVYKSIQPVMNQIPKKLEK